MNRQVKIGAAVVGSYLLGHKRKAKLAIGIGSWLLWRRLSLRPGRIALDLAREIASSPEWAGLRDQVRTELINTGKAAADAFVTERANRLASALHARTERLRAESALAQPSTEESEPTREEKPAGAAEAEEDLREPVPAQRSGTSERQPAAGTATGSSENQPREGQEGSPGSPAGRRGPRRRPRTAEPAKQASSRGRGRHGRL